MAHLIASFSAPLRIVIAALAALSLPACGGSSIPPPAPTAPSPSLEGAGLDAMVAAERAFAQRASDKDTRDAFLAFLADNAVTFQPEPSNGREIWLQRPAPAPRAPGQPPPRSLLWAPAYGEVSSSGDIGYLTGPFIIRDSAHKKPDSHGVYFSVWKRQQGGEWRVALDIGVSTPAAVWPLDVTFQRAPGSSWRGASTTAMTAEGLRDLDSKFATLSRKGRASAPFTRYFANEARLHRSDAAPLTSKTSIVAYADQAGVTYETDPLSSDISTAGDLGYTYGQYVSKKDGAKKGEGYYARVWQRQEDGEFRIVADIAVPESP